MPRQDGNCGSRVNLPNPNCAIFGCGAHVLAENAEVSYPIVVPIVHLDMKEPAKLDCRETTPHRLRKVPRSPENYLRIKGYHLLSMYIGRASDELCFLAMWGSSLLFGP
jgi:hypothetical protein